jgi:2-polyprenyl-3-methyl-5-hydroxy-6-metoxy-1,4-benzoquinol methylase
MPHSSDQFNIAHQQYSAFVDVDPIRNYLHYPTVMQELGNMEGQHILDVGCGDGLFDTMMTRAGARVTGYDKSANLIAKAKEKAAEAKLDILFEESDPVKFKSSEQFDNAVSVMVLPYAESEEYLEYFFNSTRKILKGKGRFISVIFNPKFEGFGNIIANRRFNKLAHQQVEVQFLNPKDSHVQLTAQLRQFSESSYIQAALKVGFKTTTMKPLYPTLEGKDKLGKEFWGKAETEQPYSTFITSV